MNTSTYCSVSSMNYRFAKNTSKTVRLIDIRAKIVRNETKGLRTIVIKHIFIRRIIRRRTGGMFLIFYRTELTNFRLTRFYYHLC